MVEVLMRLRLHAETPAEDPYDQDNVTDKVDEVQKNSA